MPASHGADDNPSRVTDPSGVTLDNNNPELELRGIKLVRAQLALNHGA